MPVPSYVDEWKRPINLSGPCGESDCPWCGEHFVKRSRNQIYCCDKHEEAARNARNARKKDGAKNGREKS